MPMYPTDARRLVIALKLLNPDFPPIPSESMQEASRFVRFIAAAANHTADSKAIIEAAEIDGWGRNATEDFLSRCIEENLGRYPRLSMSDTSLPPPAENPLDIYNQALSALMVKETA